MKIKKGGKFSLVTVVCSLIMHLGHTMDPGQCNSPLGMESGLIPNSSLTASSSYFLLVGPHSARLNQESFGGAWCPKIQVGAGDKEYLQVDLLKSYLITGVATQGRNYNGKGQEYAEEYMLEYWRPGMSEWHPYSRWDDKELLGGNSDTVSIVNNRLTPPVHATKFRIIPHSMIRRTICMRVELYGCLDESGIVSYTTPEPSGEKGDHVDKKYDGWKDSLGHLNGGLGGLTDGQVGGDFFSLDMGLAKGNGWIAWKNSSFPGGYMEIVFEFNEPKNVSKVDLYTNNYFSRDVQIFNTAVLFFSIGGRYFNGEPVVHFETVDRTSQKSRNVTINIPDGRVAKFVRIRLYFSAEWILLSEVYIRSEPVYNYNAVEETEQKSFGRLLENLFDNGDVERRLIASKSTNIIVIFLSILIFVLLIIFVPIAYLRKNNKYAAQSTATILKNAFNVNIKGFFMNLSPTAPADPTEITLESPRHARMSQGRRAAAAETSMGNSIYPELIPPFLSERIPNPNISISSSHSHMERELSHSPSRDLALALDSNINGYDIGFLDLNPGREDLFNSYNQNYGHGFNLGSNFDRNVTRTTGRPTMVTAVSPESRRGRAIVTLASNKCTYNSHKNLPNILQDGIHVDRLNNVNLRDEYYRHQSSNYRDMRENELHQHRFMTLGKSIRKYNNDIDDDDDSQLSIFSTQVHARERLRNNTESTFDEPISIQDRAFSLSDLRNIHARNSGNIKDSGAITIWNITPAFRKPFPDVDVDINAISMASLRLILKIGSFGTQEISIYETKINKGATETPKIVQVKTVKMTVKDASFKEYLEEVKYLSSMEHTSLSKMIGLVTSQNPPLAVFEYSHTGDLYQHLNKASRSDQTRFPVLLSIILQICSAMKYLESRETVHKDLAARNILIFPGNRIKVTDTAMCSPLYADHYYTQDGAKPLPIRWLSWECTLLKRYTCPGTVWSFAITAWEIFNLCKFFPYEKLTVNEIVKLAEDYLLKNEITEIHARPAICPEDIYKILLNCWERKSKHRPSFKEIYNFLKMKYIELVPIDDEF